jgi:hypothetical protein
MAAAARLTLAPAPPTLRRSRFAVAESTRHKEDPMGDMGGGFWAAFLSWFGLGIAAAITGLVLHLREKNSAK